MKCPRYAVKLVDLFADGTGVGLLHTDDLVVDFGVEDRGHKSGADALNLVRPWLSTREHGKESGSIATILPRAFSL